MVLVGHVKQFSALGANIILLGEMSKLSKRQNKFLIVKDLFMH